MDRGRGYSRRGTVLLYQHVGSLAVRTELKGAFQDGRCRVATGGSNGALCKMAAVCAEAGTVLPAAGPAKGVTKKDLRQSGGMSMTILYIFIVISVGSGYSVA
ncbi:hypothetical protein TA05_13780 [Citrobacter rodentium]|uniref:Membrane protein n=1 Tax=Citrobacter rodentium (strain ICC168) TaxID=637910 RepID=D2TI28_CITRI|nr:hypothetical protein TA05_13780 [Citrobacter rodentium]CBG90809.1 putative membrane protein [Citrobacter rodentium ICC168]